MLFFADVSIFSRHPFKTRRSHLNDVQFFCLAVFWLNFGNFEGSEWLFGVPAFLVPRLGPKNIKFN